VTAPDLFPYFWLLGVALIGLINVAWAINDLKLGSARMSWWSSRADRKSEPFEFWLAVGGKFAALPIAAFMFWFGLGMLNL
jgi:hypothetical protein